MVDTRNCPKCDTLMDYRLGEYECPSCGHTESGAQAVSGVPSGRSTSGPGLIAPPPPPPGAPAPGMPGSYFGGQTSNTFDPFGGGGAGFSSLESEKNLFIYINAGIYGLICLGCLFAVFAVGPEMLIALVAVLVGAAIQIGILIFILKSDQMWAKYCCMGCMGLRLIGVLFTLLAPQAALAATEVPSALEVVLQSVTILFDIWFFTILWRDVANPQY